MTCRLLVDQLLTNQRLNYRVAKSLRFFVCLFVCACVRASASANAYL